ncbi:branched-chain amino acid ABC transporter permease [Thermanaerothrix daxensis]|uniref:branched-chain amino acid ABC transporter permease n=1 Tax=Thermanaerothrix daxensis TaxID=869279 RepID=UPI0006C8FEC9|nr:branched-chain amino acid ABC transporter permease [Thermanaerothrix daxensis]
MELGFLLGSLVKIIAIIAYLYGLMWLLARPSIWIKIAGLVGAFGIVQLALTDINGFRLLNNFDSGLLFQASAMTMVALGLNLIYGFNGQFSLGQWGFYGIGAYAAADITYRWINGDARGLLVLGLGALIGTLTLLGINKWLQRFRGIPVLSSFTLYLIGALITGAAAVYLGNQLNPLLTPLLGSVAEPGPLNSPVAQQVIYFLAVILAGIFAAQISFLFGLPVLTLGSDYFGIATLGFTIVVNTLMINSDTILPFPEMKGGRGMIGIPKLTTWFSAFFFMMAVIIIMRNLVHSSTGRSIVAVREDEIAAKAMGIDVAGAKLMSFVVGSFFAGIGGAVYAHYIGFLSPGTFNFLAGFNPLIIVVFGGLGSMTGTIAASFGWIFFLEGMLRVLLSQMGTEAPTWRFVLYPITLLLLMLIRPQGLFGSIEWGFLKGPEFITAPRQQPEPAHKSAI